jgi:gingipain R
MKYLLLLVSCINIMMVQAQQATSVQLLEQSNTYCIVQVRFASPTFTTVTINNASYAIPAIQGCSPWYIAQAPDVPKYSLPIQLPTNCIAQVKIIDKHYTTHNNIKIAPSKGNLLRTVKPETIPYKFGPAYTQADIYPNEPLSILAPYYQRNTKVQVIQIATAHYTPTALSLTTLNDVTLKIDYVPSTSPNELKSNTTDVFYNINKSRLLNYPIPGTEPSAYEIINNKGEMLVITHPKYLAEVEPYIRWKTQKGIAVKLMSTDTLNTGATLNDSDIKNTIKNYYDAHPNLSYVLLVGDHIDIPTYNEFNNVNNFYGFGDNGYSYMANGDHYGELIVARMCARTPSDITNQVKKVINYELRPKLGNSTYDWMRSVCAIGSNDPTSGINNMKDWQFERALSDSLLSSGIFNKKYELFDGDKGGLDAVGNPSTNDILTAINNGVSLITYTGHGTVNAIITSSFDNTNVAACNNTDGAWPAMITVGCRPGNYLLGPTITSLAEAMQWEVNVTSNQPVGNIASAMSTVDQYWDPPMRAQMEACALLRNGRAGVTADNSFFAAMTAGFASMNDEYNTTTWPNDGNDMTDTWQLFGDPSIVLFTQNLGAITATHPAIYNQASISMPITCNTNGATACLSYRNKILSTKVISANAALLTYPLQNIPSGDSVCLTITKANHLPYQRYLPVNNWPAALSSIDATLISVVPNPSQGLLIINSDKAIQQVNIYDVTGKLVWQAQGNNTLRIPCDISALSNGIYTLSCQGISGKLLHTRVVKQ